MKNTTTTSGANNNHHHNLKKNTTTSNSQNINLLNQYNTVTSSNNNSFSDCIDFSDFINIRYPFKIIIHYFIYHIFMYNLFSGIPDRISAPIRRERRHPRNRVGLKIHKSF